jgi:hypothetical protein
MSLQIRRGLDANRTFIANEGEPLWVTDTDRLFIGDGTTTGGKAVKALPVGTASGDLSGSFPSPTVAKLQGNTVQSGTPADGDSLIYETANTRWARKPAGIAGVSVESGTPSDGESLVYETSAGRWAHKPPVLTTLSTYLAADVGFPSVNTWYDVTSLSLTAGTWLLTANTTTYGNSDYNVGHIRLYDGTNTLATSSFYGSIDYPVSGQVITTVTLASTTTVKLQCYPLDMSMGLLYRVVSLSKATGLVAVRIA